jgi:hypothetical protein
MDNSCRNEPTSAHTANEGFQNMSEFYKNQETKYLF